MMVASKTYMSQLDGLRAIAVLAVVFTHTMPDYVTQWIRPGVGGVRLFFVISGFLITGILLDAKKECASLGGGQLSKLTRVLYAFYVRRALRIFPAYYLFVFLGLGWGVLELQNELLWYLTYCCNFLFAMRGDFPAYTGHLWSLAVEEQFYLLWPLLVLSIRTSHLPVLMVFMWLAAPLVRLLALQNMNSVASGVLMPTCVDTLIAGALIAYYQRFRLPTTIRRINARYVLIAGIALTGGLCLAIDLSTAYTLRHAFLDSGFSVVFGYTVFWVSGGISGQFGKMLNLAILRYIGKVSYGIYLYHSTIEYRFGFEPSMLNFVVTSVFTTVIAGVSWLLVEEPLNQLKKHFPYVVKSSG